MAARMNGSKDYCHKVVRKQRKFKSDIEDTKPPQKTWGFLAQACSDLEIAT